jgi:NAD(P)-dependent dehydrogenase (short-subunit alcohol dehydrogenase family)
MKTMIVTGASRGIGAAIAKLAGQRGYAVCVNYANSKAEAGKVVADILGAGGKAIAVQADVTKDEEVKRLFLEVDKRLGKVDVLVNNAGRVNRQCRMDEMDEKTLTEVFIANTYSVFFCTREAVKRMSTKRGGTGGVVVTISSAAARHGGLPEETHYAASKGALDSMTVGLAREVGNEGVRVVAVRPGLIVTGLHEVHGGMPMINKVAPTIPIGRAGTVEEIADAVCWLASDGASYVHGAIIDVSGGR